MIHITNFLFMSDFWKSFAESEIAIAGYPKGRSDFPIMGENANNKNAVAEDAERVPPRHD